MIATLLALNLVFSMGNLADRESRYFPGSYYNQTMQKQLLRRVLIRWPGPNRLLEVWRETDLNPSQRVTLLLGGAAFHNPLLLPAYIEGVSSPNTRVRQAAVFGYRNLIADLPPNVSSGINDEERRALEGEMRAVLATLRANSLTEMWAAALLANENVLLPGYRGVVLTRQPAACLNSLDTLVQPEDLKLIATAYHLSEKMGTRITLLKLIEGLSLRTFLEIQQGANSRWGPKDYQEGLALLDDWLYSWEVEECGLNPNRVLARSFSEMGAPGINPLARESCPIWLGVIDKGKPSWWALASRRLYECGAPPTKLSILLPTSDEAKKRRNSLLRWYGIK